MQLEQAQIISLIINSLFFVLSIVVSGLIIWKLNFHDKNSRLLFILYILYWMSPLLCREYTGQMHLHMEYITDYGTLLWVPLIAYGIIGLFWRPLSDIFAYKLRSRKKIIYISLLFQIATIVPFLMYPCFTTNIIQSIGAGIGASCIGLFNLMFDDSYHHRKVFATVTIVALPPVLAEMITSVYESFLCTFLKEGTEGIYEAYYNVMKYIWVAALVCIIASFAVAIFVKEKKAATFYKIAQVKEPVQNKSDWWVVILLCIGGACILFMKWTTAGPSSVTQLIFIGHWTNSSIDTRFIEGYLSFLYAVGALVGTILAGIWLNKSKSKNHIEKILLIFIACFLWLIYLFFTARYPNVPVYFTLNFINGLGYGLVWASMIGMMVNKFFVKTKYLTPIGLFNTCLSVGICAGTFFNNWVKGKYFDFQSWSERKFVYEDFVKTNSQVNMVCAIIIIILAICVLTAYIIHNKYPPKKIEVKKLKLTGETEL